MKVERKEQKFQPVVITLETQDELDTLITALNVGCGAAFKEGASSYVSEETVQKLEKKDLPYEIWSTLASNL